MEHTIRNVSCGMDIQSDIANALYKELSPRKLYYKIETYGCQMNAHDSEKIAGMLRAMGFLPAAAQEDADLILFNTCCIREHAEKRVFGNVGALKKKKEENPGLLIGVCGCMMQQDGAAKRLLQRCPFVNFAFGTHCLHELPSIIQATLEGERPLRVEHKDDAVIEGLPVAREAGVSASVNIMYGCNNYCSYCIVPYVRGRERSRTPNSILAEVQGLVDSGYTEVMLLGQNVNSFGKDTENMHFAQLLHKLDRINGLRRIRFMTSHPKDLSAPLIEAMTLPSVCNHLHLPVQAGNDRILQRMNRNYTRKQYVQLISALRRKNPLIEITTDIIVGFPGETEDAFHDTLSLVDEVGYSAAFTFMYSARVGTKAASMPKQIDEAVKKERLMQLNTLQAAHTKKTNAKYIGTAGEVLIEGADTRKAPMLYGKLSNYKMVYFPGDEARIGTYARVHIQQAHQNSLLGHIQADECRGGIQA